MMEFKAKLKKEVKSDVDILSEIHNQLSEIEKPSQFNHPLGDDKNDSAISKDAPETVKLWGIINKQMCLINKMMTSESNADNLLAKELEDSKAAQQVLTRKLETYKYITKSLQEKQTTLEEQIEILSALESR